MKIDNDDYRPAQPVRGKAGGYIIGTVGAFQLRLIAKGDTYGLNNCLLHAEERPMVEIWDTRYLKAQGGQFVQRYYVKTFMETRAGILLMNTGIPEWMLSSDQLAEAKRLLSVALKLDDEQDAERCPECERSNGPHYTGPCEHGGGR